MSNLPLMDQMRKMELLEPLIGALKRPVVKSIVCELELDRKTAEKMFKTIQFEEGETSVTVMEILRPATIGEPGVFFHTGAGINFCVDRYELNGVEI